MVTESSAELDTPLPAQPGVVIAGKYQVLDVLGSGGMGTVVSARHIDMGHLVAIKFLRPQYAARAASLERFQREAAAAASVQSEHVVRVYDTGILDDGARYLVMEHLAGLSLDEMIVNEGHLPIGLVIDLCVQACSGLAAAHAVGIVHRDIKPANLFLCKRDDGSLLLKILDFGVSKSSLTTDSPAEITASSEFLGSPSYMPPEQFMSAKSVDARSDLWSLGAALFKAMTGKVPYDGATIGELCAAVMNRDPPNVSDFRPDVPVGLEKVLCKVMARAPEERYPSAGALAQALSPFASTETALWIGRINAFESIHPARGPRTEDTLTDSGENITLNSKGLVSKAGSPALAATLPAKDRDASVAVNAHSLMGFHRSNPARAKTVLTVRNLSLATVFLFVAAVVSWRFLLRDRARTALQDRTQMQAAQRAEHGESTTAAAASAGAALTEAGGAKATAPLVKAKRRLEDKPLDFKLK
ncbi:MAG: serine/threonine-protein kinase [Deltaproteobacteria bacterium]|nr:serine/threonine-protein kinase [Deltaproteobacteria bacterium]